MLVSREKTRHKEHHEHLHKVGGLKTDRTEFNPSRRTSGPICYAGRQWKQQEKKGHRKQVRRDPAKKTQRHLHTGDHKDTTQDGRNELSLGIKEGVAHLLLLNDTGGRVHHHQTEPNQE